MREAAVAPCEICFFAEVVLQPLPAAEPQLIIPPCHALFPQVLYEDCVFNLAFLAFHAFFAILAILEASPIPLRVKAFDNSLP